MKLAFIAHKEETKRYPNNSLHSIHHYALINNKGESKKYEKNGFTPLSQKAITIAKALERNTDLKNYLRTIPKMRPLFTLPRPTEWTGISPYDIYSDCKKLLHKTNLHNYEIHADVLTQLPIIAKYQLILLPLIKNTITLLDRDDTRKQEANNEYGTDYKMLTIQISEQITINEIINFFKIKANKLYFNEKVKSLRESFCISDRDFRIYDLRKEKKTFSKISEIIIDEFGLGGRNNANASESTIKTAYYRTEDNIRSLFKKVT